MMDVVVPKNMQRSATFYPNLTFGRFWHRDCKPERHHMSDAKDIRCEYYSNEPPESLTHVPVEVRHISLCHGDVRGMRRR